MRHETESSWSEKQTRTEWKWVRGGQTVCIPARHAVIHLYCQTDNMLCCCSPSRWKRSVLVCASQRLSCKDAKEIFPLKIHRLKFFFPTQGFHVLNGGYWILKFLLSGAVRAVCMCDLLIATSNELLKGFHMFHTLGGTTRSISLKQMLIALS